MKNNWMIGYNLVKGVEIVLPLLCGNCFLKSLTQIKH